jgi:hypothetical protein
MTWLTWRQYRTQIIGLLAISALLVIGIWIVAGYAVRTRAEFGVDSCRPATQTIITPSGPQTITTNSNCFDVTNEWQKGLGPLRFLFVALYVVPALVASYIGGPLFALEFERATHRLAWTQGISRLRWASMKLGILVAVAVIAALILAIAGAPSRVLMGVGATGTGVRPFDAFDLEGPTLISYTVFGIVIAAFIGAWSRRIVVAMFLGLLIFGVARVGVHNLRPSYQDPVVVPLEQMNQMPANSWFIDVPDVDREGRPVSQERVMTLLSEYHRTPKFGPPSATDNDSTFLAERGVFRRVGYQPVDRYWTFQAIEAAIFTGLAALFALLTLWRVRSRDA